MRLLAVWLSKCPQILNTYSIPIKTLAMAAANEVILDKGDDTTCTVNLHGATIVSWKIHNEEQLFVSSKAVLDGTKAIRGGVPVVFPNFGPWQLGPQHGFARIVTWTVEKEPETSPDGDVMATFSLTDSDFTKSLWDYQFRLTYTLLLKEKELEFTIVVSNPSENKTFDFTLLLHTYFRVPDVSKIEITGLKGCRFADKIKDGEISKELRDIVTVTEWTDRAYYDTPQDHIVTNMICGRRLRIQKYNFPDTVVWNPWAEQARSMADFDDDEYPNMICIEAGFVSKKISLGPKKAFEAGQLLQIM